MKKFLFLVLFCLILCGCNTSDNLSNSISCKSMKKLMTSNKHAMLIDVRTSGEYEEGHLEKAINTPYESVVDAIDKTGEIDHNLPIVVYCASGVRSQKAFKALTDAGYKKVYDLGSISNCD